MNSIDLGFVMRTLDRGDGCVEYLRQKAGEVAVAQMVERRCALCDSCRSEAMFLAEQQMIAELTTVYTQFWPGFAASVLSTMSLGAEALARLLESGGRADTVTVRFETEVYPRIANIIEQDIEMLYEMVDALESPK